MTPRTSILIYFIIIQVSTSINIPKDHHRSVLGKSGERLKQLEKATGTKITIPSIKDQSESIYVTGTRDGIEKALHEIKIISDERVIIIFL